MGQESTTLDADEVAFIEEVADELDISKSRAIKECVRAQMDGVDSLLQSTVEDSEVPQSKVRELERRLKEHERRLNELEEHRTVQESTVEESTAKSGTVEDALEGWDHGRNDEEIEANRKLARVATEWLRERGDAIKKSEAPLEEWQSMDEHPDAPRRTKTLWNSIVVDAWEHAQENTGLVEKPHSRAYEWVGE